MLSSDKTKCVLPPSAKARNKRRLAIAADVQLELSGAPSSTDSYRCPVGESACPITNPGFRFAAFAGMHAGYECLTLSSSLNNCGRCGNDCERIEGALGATCSQSQCHFSRCRDGYTFANGRCLPSY